MAGEISRAVGGRDTEDLLGAFPAVRAVVAGEAMLDVYLRGTVGRLSPEGPFPVVDTSERQVVLGGAANVAANVSALGADTHLVTVLGADAAGAELEKLAADRRIRLSGVTREPDRRTLTKTRIVGDDRTLVRLDQGSTGPMAAGAGRRLAASLAAEAAVADVLIFSDYRYGAVDEGVLAAVRSLRPRPLTVVDSKDLGRFSDVEPDAVTSNYLEVASLLGADRAAGADRVDHVLRSGREILRATGARRLAAVTLDVDGVVLVEPGRPPRHLPSAGTPIDPCGAGDTFTAALSLALAAGAGAVEAARLAQQAAEVVVRKPGTAVCSASELSATTSGKWCDLDTLVEITAKQKEEGRTIVFTNGCFDVLHAGHVACLEEAASLGDVLVVALNSDRSVARLKGPDRPFNRLADRAAVLAGLSVVDHIVAFEEDSPIPLLSRIRPDVYCKGGDYRGRWIPEMDLVRTWNGRTHYTTLVPDRSTTATVERVRSNGAALEVVR